MRSATFALAWLAVAIGLAACAAEAPLPVDHGGPRIHAVRVVGTSWHTAIVMDRAGAAATGLLPEAEDFPEAAFLEFGWGDRVYYPARDPGIAMTLGAALTATPAIMHIAGLARPPEQVPGDTEVVTLALSQGGFLSLVRAIAGDLDRPDLDRPGGSRAAPVSRGLYPDSHFYLAHGSFHLFNTCNTWTARMLRAGGVKLSPSGVVTASDLMTRLRAALDLDRPSCTGA